MTAKKTTSISLRFTFNRNARSLERSYFPRAARVIARDIAIRAADTVWDEVSKTLKDKIMRDAQREVSQIAQAYRRMIIGISGGNQGAHGTLTSQAATAFGSTQPVSSTFNVHWADRKENYIARKLADVHHARWFEYERGLSHGVKNPVNRQLQNATGQGATWIRAFGPISVRLARKRVDLNDSSFGEGLKHDIRGASSDKIELRVATVTVTAFGRIKPEMLPAIALGGSVGHYAADGRATGLVGLLPSSIAYRLGGSRKHVAYRPTLEPFLEFFLTRALPNAVMRRLDEGIGRSTDIRAE